MNGFKNIPGNTLQLFTGLVLLLLLFIYLFIYFNIIILYAA